MPTGRAQKMISAMTTIRLYAALALLTVVGALHAQGDFVIEDIRVEGLQRISPGTVFNYLPLKVGDRVDASSAEDAIRALFRTGFFRDVELRQEDNVLVVVVVERPSIARVDIVGNREFDEDTLRKALDDIGFVEGRVFNQSALDQVVQELKAQYFGRGRYAASLEGIVTPLERNRVAVTLNIDEGETAKIKKINIIGNDTFSEKRLLRSFSSGTGGLLNFITKRDRYSKQKLSADLEVLRSYYQDRGFLDFEINSTQVSITPDKRDIYITIAITEGDRYTVDQISLSGNLVVPEAELTPLISVAPGDTFSRKSVSQSRAALADRLAADGYAFANVNAIPEIDEERQTVSFSFVIDPGRRVYVRRINISGNATTQDEVIRREMRQLEGAWYSAEKINRSRERLQRLNFFDDVSIETPTVPGTIDQVDVNVAVKERLTGSFLFGVGWSEGDGLLLQASIAQRNLFGTGRELDISIDNSDAVDIVRIGYKNPYFTLDGVSFGADISRREVDAGEGNTADYLADTLSGGLEWGLPLSEIHAINFGVGAENVKLKSTSSTPPEFRDFIDQYPDSDLFKITSNMSRDTRDNVLFPSSGMLSRFAAEAGAGDLNFYKLTLGTSWYLPLSEQLTFKLFGEVGYADGYSDTTELPFFKNFYAGGPGSVRGFDARSLGPQDSLNADPIGGDKRILFNAELLLPFPGARESKDKRFSLFLDAGQVYGPDDGFELSDVRYSAGLAFHWYSLLGPLSISYGIPLNDEPEDDVENLQFTLGTLFR